MSTIYLPKKRNLIQYDIFYDKDNLIDSISYQSVDGLSLEQEDIFYQKLMHIFDCETDTLQSFNNLENLNKYLKEYKLNKTSFEKFIKRSQINYTCMYLGSLIPYLNTPLEKEILNILNQITITNPKTIMQVPLNNFLKNKIANYTPHERVTLLKELNKSYDETYKKAQENEVILKLLPSTGEKYEK